MTITTVNCPVYDHIASMTDNWYRAEGYDDLHIERYRNGWSWDTNKNTLTQEEAKQKQIEDESRFSNWVAKVIKGEYYQFIITNAQKDCFLVDIISSGFEKHLVYRSSKPSYNCNNLEGGPRLWVYLFHVKES